jgi:hypothetical protein
VSCFKAAPASAISWTAVAYATYMIFAPQMGVGHQH